MSQLGRETFGPLCACLKGVSVGTSKVGVGGVSARRGNGLSPGSGSTIERASALAALPDPVFVFETVSDPGGIVVDLIYMFLNESAALLYGKPVDEVAGHGQLELFPSAKELGVWDAYLRVIESGSPISFDLPNVDEDGVEGSFRVTAARFGDRLLVSAADITAQVKAKKALEADRATLRATLDTTSDPHVLYEAVCDEAGRVVDLVSVYANPAACAYLDMDSADLIGQRLLDLFPGHVEAGLFEQYAQVVKMGEPFMLDDFLYRQELLQAERRYDIRAAQPDDRAISYNF